MRLAQKLYENGYITYIRTDSKLYSKEFIIKTSAFIKKKYGNKYVLSSIHQLAVGNAKKKENNDIVQFQVESNNSSDIKCAKYAKLAKQRIWTKVGRKVSEYTSESSNLRERYSKYTAKARANLKT